MAIHTFRAARRRIVLHVQDKAELLCTPSHNIVIFFQSGTRFPPGSLSDAAYSCPQPWPSRAGPSWTGWPSSSLPAGSGGGGGVGGGGVSDLPFLSLPDIWLFFTDLRRCATKNDKQNRPAARVSSPPACASSATAPPARR